MPSLFDPAISYVRKNQPSFLNSLKEFVAIPSISTDPTHNQDMEKAADWVVNRLRSFGMQNIHAYSTPRHPIVYGERIISNNTPSVLIYAHYDVQPADPLELWTSGPFTPTIQGEDLFGRGVSDMKGQLAAVMDAVEALQKTSGIPVNLKWLVEGEEEIGSPNLADFILQHRDLLSCDFAFNPDAGMIGKNEPTITFALRGLAYFELRIYGPAKDLHSGVFGGVVHNPANALAELIAGMHDNKGRVTLPGFYDKVRELDREEREELKRIPTGDRHFLDTTGAPALYGEEGFTPNERIGARPTLDVNGLLSGFIGTGSKTVIPSTAMAKISCRLVPDQEPKETFLQMEKYLKDHAPEDIRWELIDMHGGNPSISDRENFGVKAFAKALETVWGKRPYFKREGGSIPVVGTMQKILGVESVIGGFGLPDDNYHAPNEKLHLPTWYRGIEALVHFFLNLQR